MIWFPAILPRQQMTIKFKFMPQPPESVRHLSVTLAENSTHDKTSDTHTMATKAEEPLPTIGQTIPILAYTISDNSDLSGQDETDTSSTTTISSDRDSADHHTTSAYENTTTLSQVTATDNISNPTVVAPAIQAAVPLDNHKFAFNETIPEFNETESARLNETKTEMLSAVNNPAISQEISVATSTAGTTSSVIEQETGFSNTTTSYGNLNENKTIPEPQDIRMKDQDIVHTLEIHRYNFTTTASDGQFESQASTSKTKGTNLMGFGDMFSDSQTASTTPVSIDPAASVIANTIFSNSVSARHDKTDTSFEFQISTYTDLIESGMPLSRHDTTLYPVDITYADRNATSSLPFISSHGTQSNFLERNETMNYTIAANFQSSNSSPNKFNSTLSLLQLIFNTSIEPDGDVIFPNNTHSIMGDTASSIGHGGTTETSSKHATTSQGGITNSILISALTSAIQRDDTIHGANLTNDPPVGDASGNSDFVRSGSGTAIHHLTLGLWIFTTSILCSV